jgi:anthranilate synthase
MTSNVDYGADFGAATPPGTTRFTTAGGIAVSRTVTSFEPDELAEVTRYVDERRGGVFSSGMEYPGRYSRWHTGYVDPCIELTGRGRTLTATALNDRGRVLLPALAAALRSAVDQASDESGDQASDESGDQAGTAPPGQASDEYGPADAASVTIVIPEPTGQVPEEQRSKRPTVFTAIRAVIALFACPDPHLGLYGAFGYDLAFQFEPIRLRPGRDEPIDGRPDHGRQRDLVVHLPDQLYVIDRKRETALRFSYEFTVGSTTTEGLARPTPRSAPAQPDGDQPSANLLNPPDPVPGQYAKVVEQARTRFAAGDLFEVVPSHEFWATCGSPAAFYERLRRHNPAPYEFFLNLGEGEYLVGASPEMYVRVTGDRVETCPIAGTIARGATSLDDAEQIRTLLTSLKEESELTMCTDVDRNDKSRICVPGSIKVLGRRQIELYSRLIHTVDHVEGRLRPGFDALDAFLTHMWAVTVTGAPKTWAMQFIEDHETSPRRWYGGAVGALGFDGNMNTGLTLRTAHIRDGLACVRTGATLLFDSEPAAEEAETRLKARALLEVLAQSQALHPQISLAANAAGTGSVPAPGQPGDGLRVLLVDHQDSFVHTLAGYFAEQGAQVTTLRAGFDVALLDEYAPHLVVLSPGPGRPSDFGCSKLLAELDSRELPAFGVCLGLQAMVEHSGGKLGLLTEPSHGKPGLVRVLGGDLLTGLPAEFTAGRYHSLHTTPTLLGGGFAVTAVTDDRAACDSSGQVVMAIEDPAARRWGVQFHPESILTASGDCGRIVVANVLRLCQPGDRRMS